MIKLESDRGALSVEVTGKTVEILADFGITISAVYNQLKLADTITAEAFRTGLTLILSDPQNAIWNTEMPVDPNAITCIIPKKKKKGDPNND